MNFLLKPLDPVPPAMRGEIQREMDQRLAREVLLGGALYPLAGIVLRLALAEASTGLRDLLLAFIVGAALLALARTVVALRFERLYDRHPSLWRTLIYGLTLGLLSGWGGITFSVLLAEGLSTAGIVGLLVSGAVAAGIHAAFPDRLGLAWLGFLVVLSPAAAGLILTEFESPLLLSFAVGLFALYLLLQSLARYREFWAFATAAVKLRASVGELERVNRELQRSGEEAARAAAAKSRFIANTSHELRTPLHGILGNAELLLATGLGERQSNLARSIFDAGKSLLHLVNDVLDLSRVESGQLRVEIDAHDPRRIIASVAQTVGRIGQAKGLKLEVTVADDVPERVMLDRERFKQILLNLAGNAVKFTEKGRVEILVGYRDDCEPPQLEVAVTDTGPGVPPEMQETIFEDFIQVTRGTSPEQEGSGLGLAICKRLVEAMDGRMGLDSEPGRGSRFWFRIPVRPSTSLETRARSSGRIIPVRDRREMRARILVVDDNPANRDLAVEQVRHLGHDVDAAPGAAEAFRAMEREVYDLVLLDCQMPDVDGYEVARRLRRMEDNPNQLVPVIAVTASAMPEERNRCLQAGMDDYITKPLNLKMLERAIDVWVAGVTEAEADTGVEEEVNGARVELLARIRDRLGAGEVKAILQEFEGEAGDLCARLDRALAAGDEGELARTAARLALLFRELGLDDLAAAVTREAPGGADATLSGPALMARGRSGLGRLREALALGG